MQFIVEMRFGSHLYGTATARSDLDLKAVYLPRARDILLQRVAPVISETRAKSAGERNTAGDVDFEAFSLQRYMALLAEGQPVALDMLFAPESAFAAPPAPLWREIQAAAGGFLSTRPGVFLRYCRQQANRFGIKGSRVAAARRVLGVLTEAEARLGAATKLAEIDSVLAELAGTAEHCALGDMPASGVPAGGIAGGKPAGSVPTVRFFEVCDKKMPFTATIKSAREIAQRLVDEYGRRALEAERNQGIDWKALSHAVRVGREAVELFETGRIVFPLACAPHLLAIKQGRLPYRAVAEEIEGLLDAVEAAARQSRLPAEPDLAAMEELVVRAYRRQIEEPVS
jgi:hypothetical protein